MVYPTHSVEPPLSKLDRILTAIDARALGLAFLVIYVTMVFPAMPAVGDAADYAASIRHSDFGTRTIHIGYNIFVFPFMCVGQWIGLTTTTVLNLLAAFCTAATITVLHRLYISLGCPRSTASLGCLVFGTTGIIWYHAEFGELQALLVLVVVSSVCCFLNGHRIAAGSLFTFGLLVSQAAAPSVVCFPLIALWKRSWADIIKFGLASSLTFAIAVAPIAGDYFLGPRGLVPSLGYYPPGSLLVTIGYFGYRLVENHTVWTIWFFVGALVAYRRVPHLLVGTLALWCSHAWVNLRLSHVEYGFAWMPFFVVSSLMIAIGALWAHNRFFAHRALTVSLVPLSLILAASMSCMLYVMPKRQDAISLQSVVREVEKKVTGKTVLATPHVGFVYVYETNPTITDVWTSTWRPMPDGEGPWKTVLTSTGQHFALLHKHHTHVFRQLMVDGPIGRLFLSEKKRSQYREEGAAITRHEIEEQLPKDMCLRASAAWTNSELVEVSSCRIATTEVTPPPDR